MWKTIFDKLKQENLNPYPPGQHQGLCTEPYVVVKEGNQIPSIQSNRLGQKVIDIIVFVPLISYVALDPYVRNVRTALKGINGLRKTGTETPAITDDAKEAYTMSIEYIILKELEG